MLTFFSLLKLYNVNPDSVRMVRHGNAEIPIWETFRNDRKKFDAYQSLQDPKKFADSEYIAVFAPYRNTLSLFLGLWKIKKYKANHELGNSIHSLIDKYSFPQSWHEKVCWYGLEYCTKLNELSERVVIDWGKSTLSWVQKNDKPVTEIKAKNSLGDFTSFDNVILSFSDLQILRNNPDSNSTWINTLSSVYGIYLIKDRATGKLYVGSAYGKGGIYGRWRNYAVKGDGGNKELTGLDPSSFEFSILEILPNTLTNADVVNRECIWKEKLGSREWGLNSN